MVFTKRPYLYPYISLQIQPSIIWGTCFDQALNRKPLANQGILGFLKKCHPASAGQFCAIQAVQAKHGLSRACSWPWPEKISPHHNIIGNMTRHKSVATIAPLFLEINQFIIHYDLPIGKSHIRGGGALILGGGGSKCPVYMSGWL